MESETINIYPNPTSGYLAIELPKGRSEDWEMIFYDAFGRVLLEKQLPQGVVNGNVDLHSLSSGVYFYKIKNRQQLIKVGKVVKE